MLKCIHFLERLSSLISLRNGGGGTELFPGALSRPPTCCVALGSSFDILSFSSLLWEKYVIRSILQKFTVTQRGKATLKQLILTPVTLISLTYMVESVCHRFYCCIMYIGSFTISHMKNCETYQMQVHVLTCSKHASLIIPQNSLKKHICSQGTYKPSTPSEFFYFP